MLEKNGMPAVKAKAVHPYEEPVINVIPLYQVGIDALKQGQSVIGESEWEEWNRWFGAARFLSC